ncbi:acetyl-CoA hydrolase/transferase family protein [Dechloromonas denitrificans]|uniref:acetyl-CoA hydrolase/transferase family protein n=1 Tax=Dechloromonas denitrificans TaxID=281362 RepID=UPI001CF8C25A|nr:acetyl-CoA hydrolase/transferase family protein [Dechloromonas denitrificans]UCV03177.1 acetyl-CoA hydrolase/transferase family protein [Dechloromonas denitrificans]UCV07496.1 acetyl-CoA hydrolase/transferase family protein [Dechloromonas denitrificans]
MQTSNGSSRIQCAKLRSKVMSAEEAANLIPSGVNVGMSGFTGAGYPKLVPSALAKRIMDANLYGKKFKIGVWTGASTAPDLDGALAMVDGVEMRLPYQSDPTCRKRINAGEMEYIDIHLSHVAQFVWSGFLGKLDIAVVEVAGVLEDGRLIPSSSVGNNKTWLDQADKIILEVNSWQNPELEGMHDIYYGTQLPPHRKPIPLVRTQDRIGEPYLRCDPNKVIAVVETNSPDRNSAFSAPDENSRKIAGHILEFFEHEVKKGRLPVDLLPLQSGVGNIANAVMAGLNQGPFENLTAYTEVLQDGMLEMIKSGKLTCASATAFSLSSGALAELNTDLARYKNNIILRPQEISNHPEIIRRLGVIAMNGMIEADIYGNVNSTHIMGTKIMNGIGGSGDFARNAYLSMFMTPSQAKGGEISCIVPMASHVDHTEHDVQILVTEQGLADLRGLSPKQRAKAIIENCAHPHFKPALSDYYKRALDHSPGKQTPHLLEEALSWHLRYLRQGAM